MAGKTVIFFTFIPTKIGLIVLGLLALVGIVAAGLYLPEQNLVASPLVVMPQAKSQAKSGGSGVSQCEVGKKCIGPVLTAVDPEGDSVIFRFYDKATSEAVIPPIESESGKRITPDFKFDQPGTKQMYVIVDDGAGHSSAEYPIIIEVK